MVKLDKENEILIIELGPSFGPWTKLNTRKSFLYKDGTTEGDLSEKEILQEFFKEVKMNQIYQNIHFGYGGPE